MILVGMFHLKTERSFFGSEFWEIFTYLLNVLMSSLLNMYFDEVSHL